MKKFHVQDVEVVMEVVKLLKRNPTAFTITGTRNLASSAYWNLDVEVTP